MKTVILERKNLDALFGALGKNNRRIIGPARRGTAIVYDEITSASDLPIGWRSEQEAAVYRLKRRDDEACFGFAVAANSWKTFLFPPSARLFGAERNGKGFTIRAPGGEPAGESKDQPGYALIGVRACELSAILIHDAVFTGGPYPDPAYRAMRGRCVIVAVNCTSADRTCFCTSMQTGPRATAGFDLCLTEILRPPDHYFLVEVGSKMGEDILRAVPHRPATQEDVDLAARKIDEASSGMVRSVEMNGTQKILAQNPDHPAWENVAGRCLACTNCTMVCPTCFCTTIEDVSDLSGKHAERWRKWDSCFTADFSYIHGGSIRQSIKSRYRQWLTHKFSTWIDQFGKPGCVGCGRCITWCPAGIDVTSEIAALREPARHKKPSTKEHSDGQLRATTGGTPVLQRP